jgi:hypothetical protein
MFTSKPSSFRWSALRIPVSSFLRWMEPTRSADEFNFNTHMKRRIFFLICLDTVVLNHYELSEYIRDSLMLNLLVCPTSSFSLGTSYL